jgi:hypothetical protein
MALCETLVHLQQSHLTLLMGKAMQFQYSALLEAVDPWRKQVQQLFALAVYESCVHSAFLALSFLIQLHLPLLFTTKTPELHYVYPSPLTGDPIGGLDSSVEPLRCRYCNARECGWSRILAC